MVCNGYYRFQNEMRNETHKEGEYKKEWRWNEYSW